jgi:hypothetical protein
MQSYLNPLPPRAASPESQTMKVASLLLFVGAFSSTAAFAATPSTPADLTKPIHQFIDGFNTGDTKSAYAAYSTGSINIVDEFAPHCWSGPTAAHQWAADYDKHAKATGVSDGSVKYQAPTRTEVEGDLAYVIVPTVYLYKQHGKPIEEEGQVTFVLHSEAGGWKIRAWTWSGVKPHPAR